METTQSSEALGQLEATQKIHIAELDPNLRDLASKSVSGVVTITWPFNAVKNTFAFILAEPDFRLRRNRGQVRVNFSGAAAREISAIGLGSNDEITLSLDGSCWTAGESQKRQSLPGADLGWQLTYSRKLFLQARLGETWETKHVFLDNPAELDERQKSPEIPSRVAPTVEKPLPVTAPLPSTPVAATPARNNRVNIINEDEFASPAFVKRARASYGSLFEDGYDIFGDDGAVQGKGRKRARFGRESGAWKYGSQSPSPEPTGESEPALEPELEPEAEPTPGPAITDDSALKPARTQQEVPSSHVVVDEACQTMDVDRSSPVPALPTEPLSSDIFTQTRHGPGPSTAEMADQRTEPYAPEGWQTTMPPHIPISEPIMPATMYGGEPGGVPAFAPVTDPAMVNGDFQHGWTPEPVQYHENFPMQPPAPVDLHTTGLYLPGNDASHYIEQNASSLDPTGVAEQAHPYPEPQEPQHFPPDGQQVNPMYSHLQAAYPPLDGENELSMNQQRTSHSGSPHAGSLGSYASPYGGEEQPGSNQFQSLEPVVADTGPSSWATVNNISQAGSMQRTDRLGSQDTQLPEAAAVREQSHSEDEPEPAPTAVEDTLNNGQADALDMYADAEVENEVDAEYSDDDEPEYDADEMGGDYDTRNYEEPDDDEDDSHDEDLRTHALEPQLEYDESEEEEEEEEYDEEYDEDGFQSQKEYESDDDSAQSAPSRAAAPTSQSNAMVIDLISSSEDEDEDDDTAQQAPMVQNTKSGKSSPAYGPATDEDEEDVEDDARESSPEDVLDDVEEGSEDAEEESEPDHIQEEDEDEDGDEDEGDSDQDDVMLEEVDTRDNPIDVEMNDSGSSVPASQKETTVPQESAGPEKQTPAKQHQETDDDIGDPTSVFDMQTQDDSPAAQDQILHPEQAVATTTTDNQLPSDSSPENESGAEAEQRSPREVEKENAREGDFTIPSEPTKESGEVHTAEQVYPVTSEPGQEHVDEADEPLPLDDSTTNEEIVSVEITAQKVVPVEPPALAPSSPPLTQSFPSQAMDEKLDVEMTEAVAAVTSSKEPLEQLPTPFGTQLPEEGSAEDVALAASEMVDHKTPDDEYAIPLPDKQVSEETDIEQTEVAILEAAEPTASMLSVESSHGVSHDDKSQEHGNDSVDTTRFSESEHMPSSADFKTQISNVDSVLSEKTPERLTRSAKQTSDEPSSFLSFRSQMETDDELQASILMDNLHEVDSAPADSPKTPCSPGIEDTVEGQAAGSPELQAGEGSTREDTPRRPEERVLVSSPLSPNLEAAPSSDQVPETASILEEEVAEKKVDRLRATKSSDHTDPSIRLARAANAARRRSGRNRSPPAPTRPVTRSRQQHKSPTPEGDDPSVRLARASLSIALNTEEESPSFVTAKLDLARRLRDDLHDCTPLVDLRLHIDKTVDAIGVAMMKPPNPKRAQRGPREYMMSFTVTDHSIAPNAVTEVSLYRRVKDALPIIKPGDIVLLRRFKVHSIPDKEFGLKTGEESAWAVFDDHRPHDADDDAAPPQIRGPPVEVRETEVEYTHSMREWYNLLDDKQRHTLEMANKRMIDAGSNKSK